MIVFIILSISPVKDFVYARGLFEDGLYDLAEIELIRFLDKYPNSVYSPKVSVLLLQSLNLQEAYKRTAGQARVLLKKYPQKKEGILLEWGKAVLEMKDYKTAIEIFNRVGRDRGKLWVGEAYFRMERYEEALKAYLVSNDPYSKLSAGWCYMKMKDYDNAISIFASIKGEYEEEGSFLYAKIIYLKGDERAVEAFLAYIRKFPEGKYRGRTFALLADIFEDKGDTEMTIYYYKSIIEENLSLSDFARYRIGLIRYNSGDYGFAIKFFDEIGKDSPYWWHGYYWKALSEVEMGMLEEAANHLKEVVKNSKELSNEALFELGSLYARTGRSEKALTMLQQVKGEFKDKAIILKGNILLGLKRYDEASSEFLKVIEIEGDNISLAYMQAAIAKKKGGLKGDALALLKTYEEKFPDGKELNKVRLLKGDVYLEQKRFRKAVEEYRKVKESNDSKLIPYALEGEAWAYMGLNKYDRAFLSLDQLSNDFPGFCSRSLVYLQLGNAAYAMKNLKEAEKAYRKVRGEYQPQALYLLGRMFFEKEKYNDAIKVFQSIKDKFSLSKYSSFASYYIALSLRQKEDLRASNTRLYSIISEVQEKEILFKSLLLLGDNYFDCAEYDSSLKYYQRGFDLLYEKVHDKKPPLELLSAIRSILLSINISDGSSKMEEKARALIRKLKGSKLESRINLIVGDILYNSGKYDRALDYLEESDSPISLLNAGRAYLKLGRKQEAIRFFERATKDKTVGDKAYLELGKIALEEGKTERAREYLSKSSLVESSLLYAISLSKGGNKKEALKRLEDLKGKIEGLAYIESARIWMDLKIYRTALLELKEAISFERAAPEGYYLMGKLYSKQGNKDEALKSLLKVKYLYPNSKWVSPSLILLSDISLEKSDTARALKYLEEIKNRGEEDWVKEAKRLIEEIIK